MSGGGMMVRFPDEEIRYGEYRGTSDMAMPRLYASWEEVGGKSPTAEGPQEWEDVQVWTNYGGGFGWEGKACRNYLQDNDPFNQGCHCYNNGGNHDMPHIEEVKDPWPWVLEMLGKEEQ